MGVIADASRLMQIVRKQSVSDACSKHTAAIGNNKKEFKVASLFIY